MKKHKHSLYPGYDEYYVRMLGKQNTKRLDQKKLAFPGFEQCLQMMRSKVATIQEDGFHFLAPRAEDYLDDLIAALRSEEDSYLKGWLLGIIGEAKSPRAFPVFLEYLHSSDDTLRSWAESGLEKLNTTSEGWRLLWEAHLYGKGLPQFAMEEEARKVREDLARFVEGSKE